VNTGLSDLEVYFVAVDRSTPTTVYAAAYNTGVYKSVDGGGTWSLSSTGLPASPTFSVSSNRG
jgi:hypothetical protein